MTQIRMQGFSRAEIMDLEQKLGRESVKEVGSDTPHAKFRNLGLYDVIVSLGPSLITVLGLWLAKNRSHERREEQVFVTHPDGTVEEGHVKYDAKAANSEEGVVRQITTLARPAKSAPSRGKSKKRKTSADRSPSEKGKKANGKTPRGKQ